MPKLKDNLKIMNILSETFDDNLDIDDEIATLSNQVFGLDSDSQQILGILAENGERNENQISALSKRNISRHKAIRKLQGIENKKNTLKDLDYVIHNKGSIHTTGTQENLYSLTLKGIVASLYFTKFDDNYMVIELKKFLNKHFGNKLNVTDLVLELIKHHIALFLIWHRFTETNMNYKPKFTKYFLEWLNYTPVMNLEYQGSITDEKIDDIFTDIRVRFFVIQSVLNSVLQKINAKHKFYHWIDPTSNLEDPKYLSVNYYELIKYWPHYLDKIYFEEPQPYSKEHFEYDDFFNAEFIMMEINQIQNKIFKKLKFKTKSMSKRNLIWKN